jgi:hypothetical protein
MPRSIVVVAVILAPFPLPMVVMVVAFPSSVVWVVLKGLYWWYYPCDLATKDYGPV